jgi:peptidoglycan hydrolase-like amidase
MLKIKRIVKKRLPQGFRGLRNCLNAPIIIIGATFLLLVCFPMFTALFLSTTCNSQFGLEWGGKWGQDILDRDSSAKSNIVIPLCGMEAPKVKVLQRSTGKIMVLSLEEYTAGVVAGEMPSSFPYEALKAQAVAARTYAVSKVMRGAATGNSMDHPHAPLCDGPHCQVYRSPKELESIKSSRWMDTQWPIIKNAVKDTRGQVMYYNGSLVEQPLFHSASGGRTENSEDVFVSALPYLRGVESPYESNAP